MSKPPCVSFVVLFALMTALPAFAQPNVSRSALALGGSVGVVGAGNAHSGGGPGMTVSAFVDVPVRPTWRVRLGAGRLHWDPSELPRSGVVDAERISMHRLNVTVIRSHLVPTLRYPIGVYSGMGAGLYRYKVARGNFERGESGGFHFLGGVEYQKFDRNLGLRFEVEMHLMGGPRHEHVWAEVVPTLSASVGISRRF